MKKLLAVLLLVVGCSSPPDPPAVSGGSDGGVAVQMPALTNCPMPSTGWQGDAAFGPLPPYGGNLEYIVPLYYRSVIPQVYVTDNASMVYGLFQGNYYTCWDATPPQWRADAHYRGYRGMCGQTNTQYATLALHVVDYGPANADPPIDEFWFQQIDPTTGLGQWYGGKPSFWSWWYYSFFQCLDLQPPYPRF